MKILVIDDDPLVRNGCRRILERDGFSCSVAAGGVEALEYVRRASFDAALVDLRMPGMSGMEVLRRLRKESPNTALVVVTGHASFDSAVEAVKAGAFDYLPKPLAPEVLTARVRRAVLAVRREMEDSLIHRELERQALEQGRLARPSNRPPAMGRVARLIQGEQGERGDGGGRDDADVPGARGSLARMEAAEIRGALRQFRGNKTKAAQHLGINRKTLREKMKKYAVGP